MFIIFLIIFLLDYSPTIYQRNEFTTTRQNKVPSSTRTNNVPVLNNY